MLCLSVGVAAAHAQWTKTSGPDSVRSLSFGTIVIGGDVSTSSVVAGKNGGIHVSINGGETWSTSSVGLTNTSILAVHVSAARIYGGSSGGGVFVSTDGGTTWPTRNSGLTNLVIHCFASLGTWRIAGTDGGIFRSTDHGASWVPASNGVTDLAIRSLTVSGTKIFAGTQTGDVFLSADSGSTWNPANTGLPTNAPIIALASTDSNLFAVASGAGVFHSSNSGNAWTSVNPSLTSAESTLSISTVGRNVFVGTSTGGVFLSTNNGGMWASVDSGLTNTAVRALQSFGFTLSPTTLFAATDDGMWRRPLAEMVTSVAGHSADALAGFRIHPTTGYVTFTLPLASRVTLEAFTPDGRRAAVLLSEDLPAGAHARRLNTTSLRSGLYFYRLRAGDIEETRKVILSK